MQLVIDIGKISIKAALFEGENKIKIFEQLSSKQLSEICQTYPIDIAIIAEQKLFIEKDIEDIIKAHHFPYLVLDPKKFPSRYLGRNIQQVKPHTLAHLFAALLYYPFNDCIVIDLGSTFYFEYISCEGRYVGGTCFPGLVLLLEDQAASFKDYEKLTLSNELLVKHQTDAVYFGILGAIERISAELRLTSSMPMTVKTIATGGITRCLRLKADLEEFIDQVEPDLTFIGLNEILKEKR